MKKMTILFLGLVLALSLAGAGFAADSPAPGLGQAVCPVMGGKTNPNLYADYQGQRVYFCCPGCVDAFKKDPERYLKKMKEQQTAPKPGTMGK